MAKQPAESKKSKKKTFELSTDVRAVADEVILKEKIDVTGVKIEYLLVYPYVGKTTAGRCIKNGNELKFFSGFDYLIEMSGELWNLLDEQSKYLLTLHELMHVMPVDNEKTGETDMKIRPHDVEDFSSLIEKYGVNYLKVIKTSLASVHDLSPTEQDAIKF